MKLIDETYLTARGPWARRGEARDTRARFSHGTIFWHPDPDVGAFLVFGAIHDKWLALGADQGALGRPISDELVAADGVGRLSNFQHGTIAWHPSLGQAFGMTEKIRDHWRERGGELSYLGYPITDTVQQDATLSFNRFQRGTISSKVEEGFDLPPSVFDVPDTVQVDSGPIVTDETVGGSVTWWMTSRGEWSWRGHVHNSGFFGLNVTVATYLNFKDEAGNAFGPPIQDPTLIGSLEGGGSRSFDWESHGQSDVIRTHWDALRDAGVSTRIDVGVSPISVGELIIVALGAAKLVALAAA